MSSPSSANVQLALSMLEAVHTLDFDLLGKLWSPDFEWHILPASLKHEPMVGREAAIGTLKRLGSVIQGGGPKIEPIEVIDAPTSGAVVIHAKAVDTVTVDGKFPFTNEYLLTVYIKEGKIVKLREFADSVFVVSFGAYMKKTMAGPPGPPSA